MCVCVCVSVWGGMCEGGALVCMSIYLTQFSTYEGFIENTYITGAKKA